MNSIRFTSAGRKVLLGHYRRSADPNVRLRAHILLLLDAGHPWTFDWFATRTHFRVQSGVYSETPQK
jgi:hypothetical protein